MSTVSYPGMNAVAMTAALGSGARTALRNGGWCKAGPCSYALERCREKVKRSWQTVVKVNRDEKEVVTRALKRHRSRKNRLLTRVTQVPGTQLWYIVQLAAWLKKRMDVE